MLSWAKVTAVLHFALLAHAAPPRRGGAPTTRPRDSFAESLTLHPLPDGKLSVLFEFEAVFSAPSPHTSPTQSHHSLTPPALLLPLEKNNVSELTISFVSGQWDQRRSGEAGPLHTETGGAGGEIRGWLRDSGQPGQLKDAWTSLTSALGGLFCAGLGPSDDDVPSTSFGHLFPPRQTTPPSNSTHFYLAHPALHLCTENLTPFLSLLPSKGHSGLSALLAQPGVVFAWGFKSEGIEVLMPDAGRPGVWRGWWEGLVDLVPPGGGGGSRAFSIESVFGKTLPRPFPEATSSELRLITEETTVRVQPDATADEVRVVDGRIRNLRVWNLQHGDLKGDDVKVWWDSEDRFSYPRTIEPPPVTVSRTITNGYAQDGTLAIKITNNQANARSAVYSEIWPWWIKGWMSEMTLSVSGQGSAPHLLVSLDYRPSAPPAISSTVLHLTLTLPPRSTLLIEVPFSKLTLKYTDHRPDAERGREIPAGILTLLDLDLDESGKGAVAGGQPLGSWVPRSTARQRIHTNRLLLDVPTPDFSMPYNVIIMSSTVMAVFFGLMHGALTRKWGFVDVSAGGSSEGHGKAAGAGEQPLINGVATSGDKIDL